MAKLDLSTIIDDVKKGFKGKEHIADKVGTDLKPLDEKDFIKLGEWWTEPTKLPGIPFGRLTTVAGGSDSGKTSLAIQTIKAALEQECGVIYCETENKTTNQDFIDWGVDPTQIILIRSNIAEEVYELVFSAWDKFKTKYPDTNLLVVVDSIGNLISLRDKDLDMLEQSAQPGGKGKANRLGLSKAVAKMSEDNTAFLLISYTYENMGSPGSTTAGGKALHLFSSLMFQTQRKGWLERTVKGEKVRFGAQVNFTLQKNHLNKSDMGEKKITFNITKDGIEYVNKDKDDE